MIKTLIRQSWRPSPPCGQSGRPLSSSRSLRAEPTVLFLERTAHLADHAREIAFPGGKIDPVDASPAAAALREAEEEVSFDRRFVEPIGYLDVHVTPSGYRILPVLARVREELLGSLWPR
jgi:8-oxo-dGTP pyrophosphatase MutT (NUDIX family)